MRTALLALLLLTVGIPWLDTLADVGTTMSDGDRHSGQLSEEILTAEFTLADDIQTYIWDIEHLFFVMNQDIAPVFKEVLQTREGPAHDKLASYLARPFEGQFFEGEGRIVDHGMIRTELWDEGSEATRRVSRRDLVETFAAIGGRFSHIDHVGSHIDYLTPDTRFDLTGGWESRWSFHVAGVLDNGRRSNHRFAFRARFSKLGEDMVEQTGWIEDLEFYNARRVSSTRMLLEDITDRTGIDSSALHDNWNQDKPPYHPVPGIGRMFDYDRDGNPDLLLTNVHPLEQRLFLYRNLGDGRFEDVTVKVGLDGIAFLPQNVVISGALVADLDSDGFEDLMVTGEQILPGGQRGHALLINRNVGGRVFEKIPDEVHGMSGQVILPPRGVAVADYDLDGLVDLFVGAIGRQPPPAWRKARWIGDRSFREGVLLRNLGGFRFENATVKAGMVGEHVDIAAANWMDLESDGDADLFLSNHMGPNVLWQNQGDGTFRKLPQPPGFGGFSMGAAAGDLDNDGDPDLYVANMYTSAGGRIIDNLAPEDYPPGVYELVRGFATGNELYLNPGGEEPFEPIGESSEVFNSGWAYGPELVDLDGDGWLDIYSPAGFQSVARGKPDG